MLIVFILNRYMLVFHQVFYLEFATDGPGFIVDEENYETLGETLALPPKSRDRREKIEKLVRPIDTIRSTKVFEKEYLNEQKHEVLYCILCTLTN